MHRLLLPAVLFCGLQTQVAQPLQAQTSNMVVRWNKSLLGILRTPGAHPGAVHPTRSFAILHVAIYDAVNSIEGSHRPYALLLNPNTPAASQDAAAAAAAHLVLSSLYPAQQSNLDTQLSDSLAGISPGFNRDEGVRIGQSVAGQILALRAGDGSGVPGPPFVPGSGAGAYQQTPPNFPNPVFTGWSTVTPFALTSAGQFRPGPPPALGSSEYAAALNEVTTLGGPASTASMDQRITGWFWNAPAQNYWNEIAQTAALAHGLTAAQSARLFALLNLTFADAVIAIYDGKYTYRFWRPVTAIRSADLDGNPATSPDPSWLPSTRNTPPDPAYPGAHSVIGAAGAFVLGNVLGTDALNFNVTSEIFAGVVRSFTSFSAASNEIGLSRIFSGAHFRFDHTSGQQMGASVAQFVVANYLTAN